MKRPSSSKPPPDRVFFTDRDLGRIVPDALRAACVRVESHDAHFPPGTLDVDWLEAVGRHGWIAITHNKDIRYNTQERDMVMRARVPLFMLIGHQSHPVLARNLVNTLPRILTFVESHNPPFIARVYKAEPSAFEAGRSARTRRTLALPRGMEGSARLVIHAPCMNTEYNVDLALTRNWTCCEHALRPPTSSRRDGLLSCYRKADSGSSRRQRAHTRVSCPTSTSASARRVSPAACTSARRRPPTRAVRKPRIRKAGLSALVSGTAAAGSRPPHDSARSASVGGTARPGRCERANGRCAARGGRFAVSGAVTASGHVRLQDVQVGRTFRREYVACVARRRA